VREFITALLSSHKNAHRQRKNPASVAVSLSTTLGGIGGIHFTHFELDRIRRQKI